MPSQTVLEHGQTHNLDIAVRVGILASDRILKLHGYMIGLGLNVKVEVLDSDDDGPCDINLLAMYGVGMGEKVPAEIRVARGQSGKVWHVQHVDLPLANETGGLIFPGVQRYEDERSWAQFGLNEVGLLEALTLQVICLMESAHAEAPAALQGYLMRLAVLDTLRMRSLDPNGCMRRCEISISFRMAPTDEYSTGDRTLTLTVYDRGFGWMVDQAVLLWDGFETPFDVQHQMWVTV